MFGLNWPLAGAALLWTGALTLSLHLSVRSTPHWLLACLLSSGFYVVLALQLEVRPSPPLLVDSLRWGLLAAALFSFARYRLSRRQD